MLPTSINAVRTTTKAEPAGPGFDGSAAPSM